MRLHPQCQCFQATHGQETVKGTLNSTDGIEQIPKPVGQFIILPYHGDTPHHVGMAVQKLGGRMHHDICTQLQRSLQHGRGKGVIHYQQSTTLTGNFGHRCDINNPEHRVGRRLHPDHTGLRTNGCFQSCDVFNRNETEFQTGGAFTNIVKQPETTAVQVIHGNHMIAGVQQLQNSRACRHSGCKCKTPATTLQVRYTLLIGIARRVVATRVFPALVITRTALYIGRGRVNRRHDRSGGRIRLLPGVYGPGSQLMF